MLLCSFFCGNVTKGTQSLSITFIYKLEFATIIMFISFVLLRTLLYLFGLKKAELVCGTTPGITLANHHYQEGR